MFIDINKDLKWLSEDAVDDYWKGFVRALRQGRMEAPWDPRVPLEMLSCDVRSDEKKGVTYRVWQTRNQR